MASATPEKMNSMSTSKPRRTCCKRAESSMPRWQIHVMPTIQATAPTMTIQMWFWP